MIPAQSWPCTKLYNNLAVALALTPVLRAMYRDTRAVREAIFSLHSFQDTFKCHLSELSFFPRYLAWERVIQGALGGRHDVNVKSQTA